MATSSDQSASIYSEVNPSAWEDVVHLEGSSIDPIESSLDVEVRRMFQEAWNTKVCSDIILCAGGTEFRAHKLVLASHSSYFKSKLDESRVSVDLEPDVLKLVLTFLYDGCADVPKGCAAQLKAAADFLKISVLKKHCQCAKLADEDVSENNCLQMWVVGRQVKDEKLSSKGLEFALKNLQSVQYDANFLDLPSECMKGYILHKELEVPSPDVKLSAVHRWTMHDPKLRLQNLAEILDKLPLPEMQPWLLKDTLHNPLLKGNVEICASLEKALKDQGESGIERKSQQQVKPPLTQPTKPESVGGICVVIVGHQFYRDGERTEASDNVIMCKLGEKVQVDNIGKFGSIIPPCTKSVLGGKTLYAAGMGNGLDELWQFKLDDRSPPSSTGSLVSRFRTPRPGAAICYKDGLVYILGGHKGELICTDSVDVFNPQQGTMTTIGSLKHYNAITSGGSICNMPCHVIDDDDDDVLVCGAYSTDNKGKVKVYKHTVQIFSISRKKVTSSVTLSKKSESSINDIVQADTNTFIIVANDYTAVIQKEHIQKGHPEKCSYPDKYATPNKWCGVAQSPNKEYVLLLGGVPKEQSPDHFLYKAKVKDILANSGVGWEKVQAHWPFGKCLIYKSNTMDVTKY